MIEFSFLFFSEMGFHYIAQVGLQVSSQVEIVGTAALSLPLDDIHT